MTSHLYIVICGNKEPYVAERELKDMGREETIRDLANGEWGNVLTGFRCNVSSIIEIGTDKDVTDEFIVAAIMQMDLPPIDHRAAAFDHARGLRHEAAE